MTALPKSNSNVVTLPSPKDQLASYKKWGKAVIDQGFCVVPSLILRAQQRLGLNPTQLAILLQLADFWWDSQRKPYPSKQTLSERLGISPRQVQRYLAELEAADLIKRIARRANHKGQLSNEYDLSGLVERLRKLAPEFERAKEEKKKVARRGGTSPAKAKKT